MLTDARTLPEGSVVSGDVCVVGAGPAGLSLALELEQAGASVVLLESGDTRWTWGGKLLTRGENADPRYYRLEWTRVRAFGGASWAWNHHGGMRSRPLDPWDVRPRPEVDRPGWPITLDEINCRADDAARLCGYRPGAFEPAAWGIDEAVRSGFGPDVEPVIFQVGPADAFRRLRSRIADSRLVSCLTHATVLELLPDRTRGRVAGLRVTSGRGRELRVSAGRTVVAAGGIESARLLLLSSGFGPRGCGNDHDVVGRFFMEHPHVRSGVFQPATEDFDERIFATFGQDGHRVVTFLRPTEAAQQRERLLATAWALHPTTPALQQPAGRALVDLEDSLVAFWRPTPDTATRLRVAATRPREAVQAFVQRRRVRKGRVKPSLFRFVGMSEQEPNPESRVTLGTRRDRHGQRLARLDWRLTARDLDTIRRSQEVMSASLESAGCGRIDERFGDEYPPALVGGGFHHMGTTRMDPDPTLGVVDTDCRVHGVENLYVAGSSVFPTGGVANPTLTLVSLALRLADHLRG